MIPERSLHIAWKYLYTAKDTWLGPTQNLGAIGSTYNLTMDPFEKYDMTFNGAVSTRHTYHLARTYGLSAIVQVPDHGATFIDKSVVDSEHQALPGRRFERHKSGSAKTRQIRFH